MHYPTSVKELLSVLHQSLTGWERASFITISVALEEGCITLSAPATYRNNLVQMQIAEEKLVNEITPVLIGALEGGSSLDVERLQEMLNIAFPSQNDFEQECLALSRFADAYAARASEDEPVPVRVEWVVASNSPRVFLAAAGDSDSYAVSAETAVKLRDEVGGELVKYEESTIPALLRRYKLQLLLT